MKTDLIEKQCAPCHAETAPLKGARLQELHGTLNRDWKLVNEHHLEREYSFRNFREALAFTIHVGAVADKEDHHPDIYLTWGKVGLKLWTHKIDGLSENDFILAAKLDVER